MNKLESKIEQTKNIDYQAKLKIRQAVLKTAEYKTADYVIQKRLLKEAEIKIMNKRYIAIIIII